MIFLLFSSSLTPPSSIPFVRSVVVLRPLRLVCLSSSFKGVSASSSLQSLFSHRPCTRLVVSAIDHCHSFYILETTTTVTPSVNNLRRLVPFKLVRRFSTTTLQLLLVSWGVLVLKFSLRSTSFINYLPTDRFAITSNANRSTTIFERSFLTIDFPVLHGHDSLIVRLLNRS